MGVTITCPKTGRSIDMGGGGFWRLRLKVAELAGDPWYSHYAKLERPPCFNPERKEFFDAFDAETMRLVTEKKFQLNWLTSVCRLIAKALFDTEPVSCC